MSATKETKKFPKVRKSMVPKSMPPPARASTGFRSKGGSKPPPPGKGLADRLAEVEEDLEAERKARATESDLIGMMLVRVAQAEERAKKAEDAQRALQRLPPPVVAEPDTSERDALDARVRELEAALEVANTKLRADASDALRDAEDRLAALTATHEETRARAETLSVGLDEMRALLTDCAGIYEELERREMAIAGIRARSLQDARALLLRAASPEPGRARISPPPLPQVLDVSEVAELIESMRPPSIDSIAREAEAAYDQDDDPGFAQGPVRP